MVTVGVDPLEPCLVSLVWERFWTEPHWFEMHHHHVRAINRNESTKLQTPCSSLRSYSASNSYTVMDSSSSSTQVGSRYPFSYFDPFLFIYLFGLFFFFFYFVILSIIIAFWINCQVIPLFPLYPSLSVLTKAPNRCYVILLISFLSFYIDSGLRFISWSVYHVIIFWMGRKKEKKIIMLIWFAIILVEVVLFYLYDMFLQL